MSDFVRTIRQTNDPQSNQVPEASRLMIKMKEPAPEAQRQGIINGLRNCIYDDSIFIFDTQDLLNSSQVAVRLLMMFFYFVSFIASILCFFGLWLSFNANVRENSWEFGVLRALGLSARQAIRIYVYEALAVVLSAVILGTFIGTFIATTLTLQSDLFSEMGFSFNFPYPLFSLVLVICFVIAILGSYLPASALRHKEIAIALKAG